MSNRHILFIVNPISGTKGKEAVIKAIETSMVKNEIKFQIFPSVANGDYSFLHNTIVDERVTDIVIVGGDGTVSQVVDALKIFPVNFGIIPQGSGNGLAFGAGISKSMASSIKTILKNKPIRVDAFRVNERFACMLCGLGFDAKIAHDFAASHKRGLSTYFKKVLHNFFKAKPYSFIIKLPNQQFIIEAYFISVANSNQFGNHFTIAPKASLSDGLLDVVIVTQQSKLALIYNTLKQVTGFNRLTIDEIYASTGVLYFQVPKIHISNVTMAPMHIDGEPVETAENIHIAIEENCFKLLAN